MRKNSVFSLLLALAMAVSLLAVPVSAASSGPRLVLSSQEEASSQEVGFTGLPDGVQSMQVTFELSNEQAEYAFAADHAVNSLPGVYTTFKQNGAHVTVYVTARTGVLTENGELSLGVISTSEALFTVVKATNLKVLNSDLSETTYPTVDEDGTTGEVVTTSPITVESSTGGKVTANRSRASAGTTVTLTVQPEAGYVLESLNAAGLKGKELSLTDKGNGKYTFTMPSSRVTVSAVFSAQEGGGTAPGFADVPADAWYAEAVAYVTEHSLMNGTGETAFSPMLSMSRSMLVTVLYRLEGEPEAPESPFTDVPAGQWYTEAVAWAAANDVVTGVSETLFAPDAQITRESLAVILYRYAGLKGLDRDGTDRLTAFADGASVSDWAKDAMSWAVSEGILTGKNGGILDPQGTATRAEVATILMRFCQSLEN